MSTAEATENGATTASESQPAVVASDNASAAELASATTTKAAADATPAQGNPSSDEPDSELPKADEASADQTAATTTNTAAATPPEKRWPGWPGDCVFRLIVPVLKVGSIIGRKGELIKKMCEETRARIRVLDGAVGTPDRIVLISGKEEPEAPVSPAMDAAIRVFKRVYGLSEGDGENKASGPAGVAYVSVRLLVASTQAINLIGKQGSLIKSIQESTGASARVLSGDEVPFYAAADERIVELQGEALKVLKALEAVVGHLRKFLVDHSVLPLFEKKTYNATTTQDRQADAWADKTSLHNASQNSISVDVPLSTKRDSLFVERETHLDSQLPSSAMSLYGQDSSLPGVRSSTLGRGGAPIVTNVIQTMQIPLSYAEDIIGIQGTNIAYIRRTSGAILTVQESRVPDEIIVEIKGTTTQVQLAQQLIQEVISNHKEPASSSYGRLDTGGLRSSYAQLGGSTSYSSSSVSSQPYPGYGSSGLGGYSTFRL
ncbi:LOW QUALITY PROTEIN: RNA-binding KH domain-containing protein PEPPER-like [Neltuma alba]|uniref:LOW QUALITY PROTEIN: RNA-binding KH domain-containing protein PEPPER-like n=1 Tax=Neltuma alba TaxID=207710 RepID=UPI0010A4D087|nr:LOW QUALITY PROTEIN: RNA-binding KH domain-containing protein PEPPER-like [Prosopis alba]